jgi:betaine-aldehyde dehydrogenase
LLEYRDIYAGGRLVSSASPDVLTIINPATEEVVGAVPAAVGADVDKAVRSARRAFDDGAWASCAPSVRAAALDRLAAALEARAEEAARLVTAEMGMPIGVSRRHNATAPCAILRYYANLARAMDTEETRAAVSFSGRTVIRREPAGVAAVITSWNYPITLALSQLAPALAAGCTIVLKPSPETALDSYVMGDAAKEAGLPPGVLNIVLGGREAGASLVSHPNIDKVGFTGSTATGRIIGAECGRLIRRVTLELGGKSAAIFLDDGDVDTFIAGLGMASFMNNSQTCTTQSRILVARSRYDEVVDAVAAYARDQRIGNPLDPEVTIGPMASEQHLNRVLGYIDVGRNSNARLVAGGGRPADQDRGWFVEPTVFADVDNSDQLAREEVFGPVMAMIPFNDDDDAVKIANDSNYGLGGSVWTSDEQRGINVARRVRTGTIGVNYYLLDLGSPFGGMKDSGIGRELGPEALNSYLEYKSIYASADQLPS